MQLRRKLLIGGLSAASLSGVPWCSCYANGKQAPNTVGCTLADADVDRVYPNGTETRLYITGQEPIVHSSGDRDFDRALAQTVRRQII